MHRPRPRKQKIVCSECKSGSSNSKEPIRFTRTVHHNMIDSSTDNVEFNSTLYDTMVSISNRSVLMWLACSDGKINSRAMQGGRTRTGEPMYIARAKTPDWNMCLGYFLPSRGACYIRWKGTLIRCNEYELLCRGERKKEKAYTNPATGLFEDSLKILSFKNPLKPNSFKSYK